MSIPGRFLRWIKHIPDRMKKWAKLSKFKKYAEFGVGLEVSSASDCVAGNPARVVKELSCG